MTFEEILDQAIAMLQRRGRLTYGTLKRQFQLDDAALEDLKNELDSGVFGGLTLVDTASDSRPEDNHPIWPLPGRLSLAGCVHCLLYTSPSPRD